MDTFYTLQSSEILFTRVKHKSHYLSDNNTENTIL